MTSTTAVRFRSAGETLVGTLTVPDGDGPFPAALVLPGSGPVDRDSDARQLRLGITREVAGALGAAGLVTLRYDKRGVGESTGSFLASGLTDLADDARAALAALRARPEVRPDRVLLVGHSEGAIVASMVAAGSDDLTGVALISASATPGEELLRWQAARIAPTLPAPVRLLLRLFRTDLVRQVAKNHDRVRATTTDVARLGGRRINARWHREFMAHDPRTDLARVTAPVLAVTGAKDLQAPPHDLEVIAATVAGPVRTVLVDDVSHILRSRPGAPTLATYRKDARRPVDPRVLEAVTSWAGALVRA
ncbi:S9 family peptidase [Actinotalea sp. Marseille-Q4924]|uniref:alpha/beta hydrolase family protein n=1 Tax=Actinotalea sp. Marseille-Q4924 TaxID=2866571 RepID=UPI001CE44E3C|nr:alpha/beta hydrolase [Actinotalea sp. Marseille-Q4924]